MKKIVAFYMLATLALSAFAADYQFPGWKCTDVDKLTAAVTAAPTPQAKCQNAILLAIAKNTVKNYAEFCALVDTTVEANKGELNPSLVRYLKGLYKKQIPYQREIWLADAWKYCQENPTDYDYHYLKTKRQKLGITDVQAYNFCLNYAMTLKNPKIIDRFVDLMIDIAPSLSGVDVKADFQKLNRKYSKNVLTNKISWEPILAKIRTTIETY